MNFVTRFVRSAWVLVVAAACGEGAPHAGPSRPAPPHEGPVLIAVTNYPLAWSVRFLAEEGVRVLFPVPAGVDPAHWSPTAEDVAALQAADVLMFDGPGAGSWIATAPLPRSRQVDVTAPLASLLLDAPGVTHRHGLEGEHSHSAAAVSTWLDPRFFGAQLAVVARVLADRLPDEADEINKRCDFLQGRLADLDQRLAAAVATDPQRPLLASHPVYTYLQRRYDLNLRSLHWEPQEDPGEAAWADLERVLADHPTQALLWEATPRAASVERLSRMGVASVVYDPLANPGAPVDLLAGWEAQAQALEQAFAP